jgi:nitrilase
LNLSIAPTICYDLRFPEIFRILRIEGAEVILIPAAFMVKTGQAHWEILLRARAIEN